jgi:Ser/Thr protein kinase RdoA (MazF antagonist)
LFPQTAYSLQGFLMDNKMLHAVVRQPFIQINQATNPEAVMEFLLANGFKVKKNYDYYHDEMSIILEDVHDENVLMKDNILFFVDTVFYLMKPV